MFGPQGRGWNRAAELPARAPAGTAVSRQDGDLCLPGSSRGCHCAPRLGDPQRGPSHQLKASGGGGALGGNRPQSFLLSPGIGYVLRHCLRGSILAFLPSSRESPF